MNEVLIDTDVLSEFLRGNSTVVANVENYLDIHENINISIISYYEVLNGLLYKDARKQLQKFEQFAQLNNILPLSIQSVRSSADIYADLRAKGKEIGHTDTLIAGIAIINEMTLVTNNQKHFKRIKGLKLENWV